MLFSRPVLRRSFGALLFAGLAAATLGAASRQRRDAGGDQGARQADGRRADRLSALRRHRRAAAAGRV